MAFINVKNFNNIKNVKEVIINNPKAKNALADDVIIELVQTLTQLEMDPQTDIIVLRGEGQAFSAGGDVKMMRARQGMFAGSPNELRQNYQNLIQKIPLLIEQMETLLIAAIDGPAIGAGLDLACMCDFRYATERSFFAESFTKIGLIPGIGGSFFFMRLIGYAKAMELTLTGRRFDANEAFAMGMLNKVVPESDLELEVGNLIEQLLNNSMMAMKMAKKSVRYAYKHDHQVILDLLSSYQGICQTDPDHLERIK